ncbi:MAG: tetratricopeptide repeat protein [Candidatus Obscuribacterales bacterium]
MAKHARYFHLAISVAIGLSVMGPAQATKLKAKPLPSRADLAGKPNYDRDTKDFEEGQSTIVPASRYKRRLDYREIEKQKEEEEAQKRQDAEAARARQIEAQKEAYKHRVDEFNKNKGLAVQYNNQAVAFGQQGRWAEAIEAHENAVKYDPTSKQFQINLSAARTAYGEQKLKGMDFASAASLFRKALAAAPDNAAAGKLLSGALQKLGMDPGDADVRIGLGDQLLASKDYQGAYIEYQQAMKIDPCAKTFVKMGEIELCYRRFSEAKKWFDQALAKDPDFGPAHRQLGFLYLEQKDITQAAAELRKAVILDPEDYASGNSLVDIWRKQVAKNPLSPEYHLGLAGAMQLTGDFVGAESEYNKLATLEPNHAGLKAGRESLAKAYQHANAEKHRKAAETLFGQGLKREALAEISQAVMIEPRNAKYQFFLGECLEANGDFKGAHQAYLTCVLIDPEKNQEAAARMKQMQSGGGSSNEPSQQQLMPFNSQGNTQAPSTMTTRKSIYEGAPAHQQMQQMPQQVPQMPQQMQQMSQQMQQQIPQPMPGLQPVSQPLGFQRGFQPLNTGTNLAGSPVQPRAMAPAQGGFEFHPSESSEIRDGSQSRIFPAAHADNPIADGGAPADTTNNGAMSASMAMVSAAEQQKDHMGAVKLLKEMLNENLEDASVHHRLAVNLMAAGKISEAVTEFRIASALKPGEKTYSEDLARAMSVNKRAITSAPVQAAVGGAQ